MSPEAPHLPQGTISEPLFRVINEFLFLMPGEKIKAVSLNGNTSKDIVGAAVLFKPPAQEPIQNVLLYVEEPKQHQRLAYTINGLVVPETTQYEDSLFPYSRALAERCSPIAAILISPNTAILRLAGDLEPRETLATIKRFNKPAVQKNN